MIARKMLALLLIILLINPIFLTSCLEKNEKFKPEIISIINPIEMSKEIKDITISFKKNVNDESIIAIISLDLEQKEIHSLIEEGNNVVLAPNMRVVAYIRSETVDGNNQHGVWIYDLNIKKEIKLAGWNADLMDIWLSYPRFSHDGKKIIFTITWLDTSNIGLATVNLDGSDLDILNTNLPMNVGAEYSPDGNLIIVTCAGVDEVTGKPGFQLCLLDSNGRYLSQLTNRGASHGSYYFTPDGKKIVFSEYEHGGFFGIINKPNNRFYIMDIGGENKTLLLNWEVGVRGFSDDGKEIIFKGRLDEKSPWGIYIINIDGTNLRHLTYFDDFLEEWYADIEQY